MNKGFIISVMLGVVVLILGIGILYVARPKHESPVLSPEVVPEESIREDALSGKEQGEEKEQIQIGTQEPGAIPQKVQSQPKPQSQQSPWGSFLGNMFGDQRPGWEILTEKEKAQLPECKNPLLTLSPVPLDSITAIEPIGSSNPPEHTLASISSDTYIAVTGQGTTQTTPLVAPGDMWIILIQPRYGVTQDPEDHVIKYAFCKNVYGVVDHVKSFSSEMKALVDAYTCPNSRSKPGDSDCPVLLLEPIKAGTPLGTVGRLQGNFNFGTWDLRVTHNFISPKRHGQLSLHSTCPFNYYSSPLRETLLGKLEMEGKDGSCGTVLYDIPGTLQGDWFVGDAVIFRYADWPKLLFFGTDNRFPSQSVIAASGMFISKPTKWLFAAQSSGKTNRRFDQVTADGSLYCYDNNGVHPYKNYEKGVVSGRIIVQLTSATELKIEYREGLCSDPYWQFSNPTIYTR